MSQSIPVIATQVGGLPEVLQDGQGGYLVAPDDVNGLADKIILLLNDESLRQEQGKKGFAHFKKNFSAERMATEYANLIRSPE